jgi:hypothetical protein
MKKILLTIPTLALLSACTTVDGPNGPQQVMTPMGAAVLQTATAAGIGAGTGALLRGVNPVAAGAISAGAGSVGSQAINAFVPQTAGSNVRGNDPVYKRLPDGSFVRVN